MASGVIASSAVSLAEAVEQIDIGGVALLRSAAKNFERVAVVCDPGDYELITAELRARGAVSSRTRQRLAVKAFAHTRDYDTAIEAYLYGTQTDAPGRSPRPREHSRIRFGAALFETLGVDAASRGPESECQRLWLTGLGTDS